jgi:hypothetical protein
MSDRTALEQVGDLYQISEFMEDEELTKALEFVAKIILKPDIPLAVISIELVRMQAISAKLALRATWMANVDKSDRAKKNMYYTAAEQLNLLCQTLKYSIRT